MIGGSVLLKEFKLILLVNFFERCCQETASLSWADSDYELIRKKRILSSEKIP